MKHTINQIDILILRLQIMIAGRGLRFKKRERRNRFEESLFNNIHILKLPGKLTKELLGKTIILLGSKPKEREEIAGQILDALDILEKKAK